MKNSKKRLTLWQIAELSGTSKSTVSRVLTNDPHVSEKTRKRVEAVIKEHNFQPNVFARGLRGGRTGQIAVIGQWMERGFISDVIRGIDDEAKKHDAHLLNCFAHSPEDHIALWRKFAQSGQADGSILIAPPSGILSKNVEPEDVPIVLCACRAANSRKGWKQTDSVTLDNLRAMEQLLQHLLEQGCKHLVHMGGSAPIYETKERAAVFEDFIAHHRELRGEVVKVAEVRGVARERAVEYIEAHPEPPDAFVCFNDDIAVGVIDAIKEKGLSVPADVAVTGFDDTEVSEFIGLTTIHVPGVLIGQESAKLLFARLNEREESRIARNTMIELTPKFRSSSLHKRSS